MLSLDDYQNFSYLVTYYCPLRDCWVSVIMPKGEGTPIYNVHIVAAAECVSVVKGPVAG